VNTQQATRQPSAKLLDEHHRINAHVLADLLSRLGLDRVEAAMISTAPVLAELIETGRRLARIDGIHRLVGKPSRQS
jgi:hypothetical protein